LWNHSFLLDSIINLYGFPCTMIVDQLNQTYVAGIIITMGFSNGYSHSFGYYWAAPIIFTIVYNSSGSLYSFEMWNMQNHYISTRMTFDTSCNLYLMGTDKEISQNIIFKYNSSGYLLLLTPDWQKDEIVESIEVWEDIYIDLFNNIYCCGTNYYYTGKSNYELYLVKFDSTGNLEFDGAWKNSSYAFCRDIYIDSNSSIYLTGRINNKALVLKNPILGEFSNPPFIDTNMIIALAVVISVCGTIGIYFFIRFRRRSH